MVLSFQSGKQWLLGAIIAVAAVATWYWWPNKNHRQIEVENQHAEAVPVPLYSECRFLNAQASAQFIGTAACAGCHPQNHNSYLLTAHSRALADINPKEEPPDGTFTNKASGRTYQVYRQNGQLHHQELLIDSAGKEIAGVDHALRYRIGSGQHARAYAVEVDGFLHQSPLAWYEAKKKWDMSPGFDVANHGSFERPIELECMACHSGRAEEIGNSLNRLKIVEKAIGCENCHGPGSLHQEFHRSKKLAPGEEDLTIVHPGRLPRPLLESICSSCHLGDPAIVPLRERRISDFQPGRPLNDFRIHYRMEGSRGSMTVVGHVDQMHQSACYQKSPAMTCLTCHDPHQKNAPLDRMAFFREKCLNCHNSQPCKLELAERLKKDPRDNCVRCHMPPSDTDIPHVAFTHHRIGLHAQLSASGTDRIPELVSTDDVSRLSNPDRARSLGLAYQIVLRNPQYTSFANEFRERARIQLESAYSAGMRDPETLIGLAEIQWNVDRPKALEFAREALTVQNPSPKSRVLALMLVAYADFLNHNDSEAISGLEELIQKRRHAEDWRRLGTIYLRQNAPDKAVFALQRALEIRPFRSASREGLAEAYDTIGKSQLASEQREKSKWLLLHKQD